MITLKQLLEPFRGELAWMRIYPGGRWAKPINCMSVPEIRDAVNTYGEAAVRKAMPGYRFIIVWLEG